MEKFNPTYNLEEFKNSDYEITKTAQKGAENLGFTLNDIDKAISTMESKHFYKSMTSYAKGRTFITCLAEI